MKTKKDLTYEQHFDKLYQDMINYEEQANMGMMDEAIKETIKDKGFIKTDLKKQALKATLKQVGGSHYCVVYYFLYVFSAFSFSSVSCNIFYNITFKKS